MKTLLDSCCVRMSVLALLLSFSSLLFADAVPSDYGFIDGVNFDENVVFNTVDGSSQVMDIYYPDADTLQTPRPWMVFIHGGGWAGGTKDNILSNSFLSTLQNLIDSGVVCVTVKYRLASSTAVPAKTSFNSVVDCKDAARFLLKNAEYYNLDKKKYGIWGGSAGGHLSLVTALAPDEYFPGDTSLSDFHPEYKCVASFFPFTSCLNSDLRPNSIFEDGSLFYRLLGGSVADEPELAYMLSPAEFLSESTPPIMLLHGENDKTLPIINSYYMMEVAEEVGADVELLVVENGGHSFSGSISPSFEEIGDSCANYILSKLYAESDLGIIQAEDYTVMSGVEIGSTTDEGAGDKVSSIESGDWMEYEVAISRAGTYSLEYRISSTVAGSFSVQVNGESAGSISFDATGDAEIWENVSSPVAVSFIEGNNTIRVTSDAGEWNLNWISPSSECYQTSITPSIGTVNLEGVETGLLVKSEIAVLPGFGVVLNALPSFVGSWSWTGPEAFSDSTNEISFTNIQKAQAGQYIATYTNSCGQQSVQEFTVNVVDSIRFEAEDYDQMDGVLIEMTSDVGAGSNVSDIDNGDWLEFEIDVPLSGMYAFDFRVSSVSTGGSFTISSDAKTLGTIGFNSTGGLQNWETISSSSSVYLKAGLQTILINSTMGEWSMNWFELIVDEVLSDCSLPYTTDSKVIMNSTFEWTSGIIDITCEESVSISADIMSIGTLTESDYIKISYKVDGGDLTLLSEHSGTTGTITVSVEDLEGDIIEIFIDGYTSSVSARYFVMNVLMETGSVVTTKLEAEAYDAIISGTSIVTEACSDDGLGSQLGYVAAGDWCMFKDVDLTNLRTITARISSKSNSGNIEVRTGSETGNLIGTIAIESTGSWTIYESYTADIAEVSSVEDVYFVFSAGFNINWFELYASATVPDPSSVHELADPLSELQLYPNPVNDILNVVNVEGSSLEIFNSYGQLVLTNDIMSNNQAVALTSLDAGMYFVKVVKGDQVSTRKIIKHINR